MSRPPDDLAQVSWHSLTAAGRTLVAAVRTGGRLPPEVVTVSVAGNRLCLTRLGNRSGRRRRLEEADLSVAEELGVGTVTEPGASRRLSLLRLPWPGMPLAEFFRERYPALSGIDKRRFLVACGGFLRRLHDRGGAAGGCPGREVMVAVDGARDRFCLCDVRPFYTGCRPLASGARFKALGRLWAAVFSHARRSERLRFAAAYLDITGFDAASRRLLRRLERIAQRQALRQWQRDARRCLSSNRDFVRERRDGFRIHRLRSQETSLLLERLLPDPDRIFAGALILKPGSRTHGGRVPFDGRGYFLKRYNAPRGWGGLFSLFRRSRALRTWLATWGFIARGLPVARPVLCLEKRRLRLLGSCYILMEFVEGTDKLAYLWPRLAEAGRTECLLRLGSVLGRLHYSGGLHGDLKWNNIVLPKDDPADVRLVDFDGSRILRRPSLRRAQRDFDRFMRDLHGHDVSERLQTFCGRLWRRWTGGQQA